MILIQIESNFKYMPPKLNLTIATFYDTKNIFDPLAPLGRGALLFK